ncbi:MAG: hypothetical protein LBU05_04105, partial [Bifidobacteriaceae bacterium]|nr:hypothetical protein [Bifidobacteriaceae bacterium]
MTTKNQPNDGSRGAIPGVPGAGAPGGPAAAAGGDSGAGLAAGAAGVPPQPPLGPADILAAPPVTATRPPVARPAAPRAKRPVLTMALGGALIAILAFGGGVLTGRATVDSSTGAATGRGGAMQRPDAAWPSGAPGDLPSGAPDGGW